MYYITCFALWITSGVSLSKSLSGPSDTCLPVPLLDFSEKSSVILLFWSSYNGFLWDSAAFDEASCLDRIHADGVAFTCLITLTGVVLLWLSA